MLPTSLANLPLPKAPLKGPQVPAAELVVVCRSVGLVLPEALQLEAVAVVE